MNLRKMLAGSIFLVSIFNIKACAGRGCDFCYEEHPEGLFCTGKWRCALKHFFACKNKEDISELYANLKKPLENFNTKNLALTDDQIRIFSNALSECPYLNFTKKSDESVEDSLCRLSIAYRQVSDDTKVRQGMHIANFLHYLLNNAEEEEVKNFLAAIKNGSKCLTDFRNEEAKLKASVEAVKAEIDETRSFMKALEPSLHFTDSKQRKDEIYSIKNQLEEIEFNELLRKQIDEKKKELLTKLLDIMENQKKSQRQQTFSELEKNLNTKIEEENLLLKKQESIPNEVITIQEKNRENIKKSIKFDNLPEFYLIEDIVLTDCIIKNLSDIRVSVKNENIPIEKIFELPFIKALITLFCNATIKEKRYSHDTKMQQISFDSNSVKAIKLRVNPNLNLNSNVYMNELFRITAERDLYGFEQSKAIFFIHLWSIFGKIISQDRTSIAIMNLQALLDPHSDLLSTDSKNELKNFLIENVLGSEDPKTFNKLQSLFINEEIFEYFSNAISAGSSIYVVEKNGVAVIQSLDGEFFYDGYKLDPNEVLIDFKGDRFAITETINIGEEQNLPVAVENDKFVDVYPNENKWFFSEHEIGGKYYQDPQDLAVYAVQMAYFCRVVVVELINLFVEELHSLSEKAFEFFFLDNNDVLIDFLNCISKIGGENPQFAVRLLEAFFELPESSIWDPINFNISVLFEFIESVHANNSFCNLLLDLLRNGQNCFFLSPKADVLEDFFRSNKNNPDLEGKVCELLMKYISFFSQLSTEKFENLLQNVKTLEDCVAITQLFENESEQIITERKFPQLLAFIKISSPIIESPLLKAIKFPSVFFKCLAENPSFASDLLIMVNGDGKGSGLSFQNRAKKILSWIQEDGSQNKIFDILDIFVNYFHKNLDESHIELFNNKKNLQKIVEIMARALLERTYMYYDRIYPGQSFHRIEELTNREEKVIFFSREDFNSFKIMCKIKEFLLGLDDLTFAFIGKVIKNNSPYNAANILSNIFSEIILPKECFASQ